MRVYMYFSVNLTAVKATLHVMYTKTYHMTKKDENEPEDKALRRLNEFNRQRAPVPSDTPPPNLPESNAEDTPYENPVGEDPDALKENSLQSPKNKDL